MCFHLDASLIGREDFLPSFRLCRQNLRKQLANSWKINHLKEN
jgi:hypothetical protein